MMEKQLQLNKSWLLVFSFFSIFSACQQGGSQVLPGTETISIDLENDAIEEVVIDKIIPFESSEAAIFGHVSRIAFLEDKVFILDGKRSELYLFDSSGQFIKKSDFGKGPGELFHPTDFSVSETDEKISVFDAGVQKLIVYDLDLNHIQTIGFPETRIVRWFEKLPADNWLVHYQNPLPTDEKQVYSYLIYSPDFVQLIDSILPDPVLSNQKISMYNPISRENGPLLFCRPFDHYLYGFQNGRLAPLYYLDFGSYNVKPEEVEKEYKYVYRLVGDEERVSMLGDIIHSTDYVAVSVVLGRKIYYIIYSKKEKRTVCSFSGSALPKGVLKGMADDSTFILIVEPEDFLDFAKEKGIDENQYANIQPDGNNLMVLFNLGSDL